MSTRWQRMYGRMLGKRHVLAAALVAALLAEACDGSGAGEPSAAPSAVPTQGATAGPTATVSEGRITSESRGYSAEIPSGWSATPAFIESPAFIIDRLEAEEAPSAAPTVGIQCELEPEGTSDEWVESQAARIERVASATVIRRTEQVAGKAVVALDYETNATTPDRLLRTAVLLPSDGCYFILLLSAPPDSADSATVAFQRFPQGFNLLAR